MRQTLAVLAILALFLGSLIVDAATDSDRPLSRQRRRLDQLGQMMTAATGQRYSSYIGYGSFCGPGGAGTPVDSLDACCQKHDQCYGVTRRMNAAGQCENPSGPKYHPYLSKYNYKNLGQGRFECLDDNSKATGYFRCLYELCVCDKVFAECLTPIKDQYNPKNLKQDLKYIAMRQLVLAVESSPNVSEWMWKQIESLLN